MFSLISIWGKGFVMQLRFATNLSAEEYVRGEAWKDAKLEVCPIHPEGGCGFHKNGTYRRKYPEGTKIARWYCSMGHGTFSFLPDCLSARLPGELKEVEKVIEEVEKSSSQEIAVARIRVDIFLPGALRWVRRRILPIRSALTMLIELIPSMFSSCEPTLVILSSRALRYIRSSRTPSACQPIPTHPAASFGFLFPPWIKKNQE